MIDVLMSSQSRSPRLYWRIDDHAGRRYADAVLSVMGAAQAALQIRRWRCAAARGAARVEDDDAHPIACGRTRSTPAERYRADAPGCDTGALRQPRGRLLSMPRG